jgi:hypothetical protein
MKGLTAVVAAAPTFSDGEREGVTPLHVDRL